MLEVSRSSWHARIYRWWYQQKYGATREQTDYSTPEWRVVNISNDPTKSNLCPYMRAVMFWSWMRWLFIGGRVWKIRVPFVVWGLLIVEAPRWAGIISYDLKRTIWIGYAIAVALAVALAVLWLGDELQAKTGFFDTVLVPARQIRRKTSTFGDLVSEYLRSAHDRVCPEVLLDRD